MIGECVSCKRETQAYCGQESVGEAVVPHEQDKRAVFGRDEFQTFAVLLAAQHPMHTGTVEKQSIVGRRDARRQEFRGKKKIKS